MVNLNSKKNLQNWKSRGGSTTQERFLEESTQEKASNTAETQPFSFSEFCRPGSFLQIQFPSVQEKAFLGQPADPPKRHGLRYSFLLVQGGGPPRHRRTQLPTQLALLSPLTSPAVEGSLEPQRPFVCKSIERVFNL